MCFRLGLAGLLAILAAAFWANAAATAGIGEPPYVMVRHVKDWMYSPGKALTVTTQITSNASNTHQINYIEEFAPAPEQWNLSTVKLCTPNDHISIKAIPELPGQIQIVVDMGDGLISVVEFSYSIVVPSTVTGPLRITATQFKAMPEENLTWHFSPVVTDLYPADGVPNFDSSDKNALNNYMWQLELQAEMEGWTFDVKGTNFITRTPKSLLQTTSEFFRIPKPSKIISFPKTEPDTLPERLDWRERGPKVPVRDQGRCACCWAFALTSVAERLIAANENIVVDISEQWLLDCNGKGWNCDYGWNPYEMLIGADSCRKFGLVIESEMPYQQTELTCECSGARAAQYIFTYEGTIDENLPFADKVIAIKQAIMQYGPVWTAIQAGTAPFFTYSGGVFNYTSTHGNLDHSVALEGWDDSLGTAGAWILRNSWGDLWGENGYMYIEYGSSMVGSYTDVIGYSKSRTASIQVIIEPQAAVDAGAKWSVDGGANWLNCADTIENLAPGDYTITYKDVSGFISPPEEILAAGAQENIVHTAMYVTASLEGETLEGEGEGLEGVPVEGEEEEENELPDDITDNCCSKGCDRRNSMGKHIGDWLLMGMSMLVLVAFASSIR